MEKLKLWADAANIQIAKLALEEYPDVRPISSIRITIISCFLSITTLLVIITFIPLILLIRKYHKNGNKKARKNCIIALTVVIVLFCVALILDKTFIYVPRYMTVENHSINIV